MQRGWPIAVIALGLVGLVPSVCWAAPPAQSPADTEGLGAPPANLPSVRRWYGWQIFSADALAGALFLGAVADDHSATLFGLSGVAFAVGGPAVHVAHGRWDVALGSLGLRVLGPVVGVVIGAQGDRPRAVEDDTSDNGSSSKWAITGVAIGGLVASVLDGLLLSYDPPAPRPAPHNQLLKLESLPQLLVLRQGIGLGYSGQF